MRACLKPAASSMRRASGMMRSPPTTSDSLLASARTLPGGKRLVARAQPRSAHERVHDDIGFRQPDQLGDGVGADAERSVGDAVNVGAHGIAARIAVKTRIAHGGMANVERAHLLAERLDARVDRQPDDLELVGVLTHHVERLRADGPG